MEMHPRNTKNRNKQKVSKSIKDLEKECKEEINNRLDQWNTKKKEIVHKPHPINKKPTQERLFDIKPWTLWWHISGENIGRELGSHVNHDETFLFNRPCIIVSKVNSQVDSDHTLVTILPMSSKSEGVGRQKKYIHKLDYTKYPKNGKLKGLKKDSFVVCHQIKTIDTKRLTGMITHRIEENDIESIRTIMKNYIDII